MLNMILQQERYMKNWDVQGRAPEMDKTKGTVLILQTIPLIWIRQDSQFSQPQAQRQTTVLNTKIINRPIHMDKCHLNTWDLLVEPILQISLIRTIGNLPILPKYYSSYKGLDKRNFINELN